MIVSVKRNKSIHFLTPANDSFTLFVIIVLALDLSFPIPIGDLELRSILPHPRLLGRINFLSL